MSLSPERAGKGKEGWCEPEARYGFSVLLVSVSDCCCLHHLTLGSQEVILPLGMVQMQHLLTTLPASLYCCLITAQQQKTKETGILP